MSLELKMHETIIDQELLENLKNERSFPRTAITKVLNTLYLRLGVRYFEATQKWFYDTARAYLQAAEMAAFHADDFIDFYPSCNPLIENKVYHMDCRDGIPLCKPNKPKGVITDFPYGIDFQSNMRKQTPKFNKILNDEEPFIDSWIRHSYKVLPEGGFFVSFYRWDIQEPLFNEIVAAGFKIVNQLIWVKGTHGMGDLEGSFGEGHESAVFAVKGKFKFPAHAGRPSNILRCNGIGSGVIHPNEKPVALIQSLVRDLTMPGDVIIEPFSGSGAGPEAIVKEGRKVIAFELDDRPVSILKGKNYIQHGNARIEQAGTKLSLF